MQSLSIWDVIFDNERLLLRDQGFLWNHLLVFGLAQLISTFMLAVQIEHLRQRIEANERGVRPDDSSSGTRY